MNLNACSRYGTRTANMICLNNSKDGKGRQFVYFQICIWNPPCNFLDSAIPVESDTDDEGAPRISLAEMLEDLHISQDATGEEGESMMTQWH